MASKQQRAAARERFVRFAEVVAAATGGPALTRAERRQIARDKRSRGR